MLFSLSRVIFALLTPVHHLDRSQSSLSLLAAVVLVHLIGHSFSGPSSPLCLLLCNDNF